MLCGPLRKDSKSVVGPVDQSLAPAHSLVSPLSLAPAGEHPAPDLTSLPHALSRVGHFTVPTRPGAPFPGTTQELGLNLAVRSPFVPLWGQIVGLGFGKWKHSSEISIGTGSPEHLPPRPTRKTWLGWWVPELLLGMQAQQRQAWKRHSSCLPQSLYKTFPGKRGNGRAHPAPVQTDRERVGKASCHFNFQAGGHTLPLLLPHLLVPQAGRKARGQLYPNLKVTGIILLVFSHSPA